MNSEKVKEIKEKLQEEIFIANSFGNKLRKVPTKELENLLTLINGLESENERDTYHCKFYCYGERPITRPPQSWMFVKEL